MTPTVDLVIVGMTDAAAAAATDAVRRGERVLVVGESKDACYCRGLRRAVHAAIGRPPVPSIFAPEPPGVNLCGSCNGAADYNGPV